MNFTHAKGVEIEKKEHEYPSNTTQTCRAQEYS